ncbi:MAG: Lrp/AsnC family transcriptional regulator [Clostridiales bacterium]|nr:Lrp/AsnC family transcriptional regulator [Clostridiales bacterium]MCD7802810.1 Lrp/AsnC family transcriptional regulator [Clostridiales bacterium]MCD7881188.1 Lrp/AsnC family transcriptional regulator [Clostridiales bacterium]MCD8383733.1 Lrp/AsnC family transcriptional regulator [Clostridiales bacterium]
MDNLLRLLEGDCTLSRKQLAAMVGTSPERVDEAIRDYENKHIIMGYKAVIDWDATDRQDVTALIEVKVEPQRDNGFDRVAERIYQYEEVESCYLMSGDFDMTVIISGRSLQEVARFVSLKLSTIDEVKSTATHFILKKYKENHLIFKKPEKQEEGFYFV